MKEFKNYHPFVNFIYFLFVIVFSVFFMHPLCLLISLFTGILYFKKSIKTFLYLIPVILITSLINPLFNHEGNTVISYFPSGNPLTLESIIYGVFASMMLFCVIIWFSSFNEVMTSDKITYLFGRILPSLSLIFSMTLNFIPRFKKKFKDIYTVQKHLYKSSVKQSFFGKLRLLVKVVSIMITYSLENCVETADSMKARGYGQKKRTSFSIYAFTKRDVFMLVSTLISGLIIIFGIFSGKFTASYFPIIKIAQINEYMAVYLLMCLMPLIIELREVIKWKSIK